MINPAPGPSIETIRAYPIIPSYQRVGMGLSGSIKVLGGMALGALGWATRVFTTELLTSHPYARFTFAFLGGFFALDGFKDIYLSASFGGRVVDISRNPDNFPNNFYVSLKEAWQVFTRQMKPNPPALDGMNFTEIRPIMMNLNNALDELGKKASVDFTSLTIPTLSYSRDPELDVLINTFFTKKSAIDSALKAAKLSHLENLQKATQLEENIKTLTSKLETARQEVETAKTEAIKVQGLNEKVEQLSRELETAKQEANQVQDLDEKVERLSRELETAQQEANKVPGLNEEVERLSRELETAQQEANKVQTLNEEVKRLSRELEAAQQEANQVQTLNENVERLSRELETAKQDAKSYQLTLQQRESEYKSYAKEATTEHEKLQRTLAQLQKDLKRANSASEVVDRRILACLTAIEYIWTTLQGNTPKESIEHLQLGSKQQHWQKIEKTLNKLIDYCKQAANPQSRPTPSTSSPATGSDDFAQLFGRKQ